MEHDLVMCEVAQGRYRQLPLAQVLLAGGKRAGRKKWPSGLSEPLYKLPMQLKKKDDGKRGIGGGKSFLSERERKSLEQFIGPDKDFKGRPIHIRDAQHARQLMAAKGLRFAEKGEEADERFDAHLAAANGENVGDALSLEKMDLWGDEAKRKPFGVRELRETYLANCQKYGTQPTWQFGS